MESTELARLRQVAGKQTTRLTHYGRKTGKPHEVTIWFVMGFLTDRAEHERAMAAIRRKYWMFRPIIELGRFLAAIGLMRDKTGSFEVLLAG